MAFFVNSFFHAHMLLLYYLHQTKDHIEYIHSAYLSSSILNIYALLTAQQGCISSIGELSRQPVCPYKLHIRSRKEVLEYLQLYCKRCFQKGHNVRTCAACALL